MIALVRNSDNRVMNDRQGSDWKQKNKLFRLQEQLANLPDTEPTQRQNLQDAIAVLQAQWDLWNLRRQEICAQQFGGVASDYSVIPIPSEQEQEFLTARFVSYTENVLTCDTRPLYSISGSTITVSSGWVKSNERLIEDDVTDFSSLSLAEPLYFRLVFAKHEGTQEISVQLLTRAEEEEFSALPVNLVSLWTDPICEGRVNTDNSITLGRF